MRRAAARLGPRRGGGNGAGRTGRAVLRPGRDRRGHRGLRRTVTRISPCHAPASSAVRRPVGRVETGSGSDSLGIRNQCRRMQRSLTCSTRPPVLGNDDQDSSSAGAPHSGQPTTCIGTHLLVVQTGVRPGLTPPRGSSTSCPTRAPIELRSGSPHDHVPVCTDSGHPAFRLTGTRDFWPACVVEGVEALTIVLAAGPQPGPAVRPDRRRPRRAPP
jgi:hypothetical protein